MNDVVCTLVNITYSTNNIGVETKLETTNVVPIIRIENIYKSEFYQASQQGLKPSLRLVISTLNYADETELIYMNKRYSIIRTEGQNTDEITLICERKIGNES